MTLGLTVLGSALAVALMGWMLERERGKRKKAEMERAAFEQQSIRIAGQLAETARVAQEQITRLETSNASLRASFTQAVAGLEDLVQRHPTLAGDLLSGVFKDAAAATAGAGESTGVPEGPPAKVPGTGGGRN